MPRIYVYTESGQRVGEIDWYMTEPKRGIHVPFGCRWEQGVPLLYEALRLEEQEAQRAEAQRAEAEALSN